MAFYDTKKNNGYHSLFKKLFGHAYGGRFFRTRCKTAITGAASIVHCKLDYCNFLTTTVLNNLPKSQINRLQQIQNCLARTVVKAPTESSKK